MAWGILGNYDKSQRLSNGLLTEFMPMRRTYLHYSVSHFLTSNGKHIQHCSLVRLDSSLQIQIYGAHMTNPVI